MNEVEKFLAAGGQIKQCKPARYKKANSLNKYSAYGRMMLIANRGRQFNNNAVVAAGSWGQKAFCA